MQKLLHWLDEPGKRFFRIVIFQIVLVTFLVALGMMVPIDNSKASFLLCFWLAGVTSLVALVLVVIGCSWPLMTGLSIMAFVENMLIIPLATVDGAATSGMISINVLVISSVVVMAFCIFFIPVMFIIDRVLYPEKRERTRIPIPS